MNERAHRVTTGVHKAQSSIVFNCPKCDGTGMNQKEAIKIEMAASECTDLFGSDEAILEIKVARKKKHVKKHKENPDNSSYGFCTCYIEFEHLKGLLVGDIPIKFCSLGHEDILPRDITVEGEHDKKPLTDFLDTYLNKFDDLKKNSVGINLFGKIGTGKTFITQLLGSEVLRKRYSVHYIPYFSLAKMFSSFDDAEVLREILDVDFLIVDEIGNEHPNRRGYSGEIAFAIQKRIQAKKVTIFGFNGTPSEAEVIELYGGSFFSVMNERNINVTFTKKAISKKDRTKYIRKVLD